MDAGRGRRRRGLPSCIRLKKPTKTVLLHECVDDGSSSVSTLQGVKTSTPFVRTRRSSPFDSTSVLFSGWLHWLAEWEESGEQGEILKSCAKLNGESLGWIFNVGTGGDFKIVHKLNGGSLGWILNVEWLRSLRKRGEVLKSCAKLNGESLGWCLPVGTHYYLLLISVQRQARIG